MPKLSKSYISYTHTDDWPTIYRKTLLLISILILNYIPKVNSNIGF